MNNTFDFKHLKAGITIEQVLAAYGLNQRLHRRNDNLYGPCPLHHGDNPTAFRVNLARGVWNCYTACGGGDLVELVRRVENCSYAQAARILVRLRNSATSTPSSPFAAQKQPFKPFIARLRLNPNVLFLQQQKRITPHTAMAYEAGTTENSRFLKNMVALRLHDFAGNPLGYCGRRLDPNEIKKWGKWRFPQSFPKSAMLFNAHRAEPHLNKGIILVECPWATLRFSQAGVKNVVSLLGTTASIDQLNWIAKAPKALLMLDGDPAGRKGAMHIAEKLSLRHVKTTHYQLSDGTEPEDLPDEQLRSIAKKSLFL